jgi:hypothetical protein
MEKNGTGVVESFPKQRTHRKRIPTQPSEQYVQFARSRRVLSQQLYRSEVESTLSSATTGLFALSSMAIASLLTIVSMSYFHTPVSTPNRQEKPRPDVAATIPYVTGATVSIPEGDAAELDERSGRSDLSELPAATHQTYFQSAPLVIDEHGTEAIAQALEDSQFVERVRDKEPWEHPIPVSHYSVTLEDGTKVETSGSAIDLLKAAKKARK